MGVTTHRSTATLVVLELKTNIMKIMIKVLDFGYEETPWFVYESNSLEISYEVVNPSERAMILTSAIDMLDTGFSTLYLSRRIDVRVFVDDDIYFSTTTESHVNPATVHKMDVQGRLIKLKFKSTEGLPEEPPLVVVDPEEPVEETGS